MVGHLAKVINIGMSEKFTKIMIRIGLQDRCWRLISVENLVEWYAPSVH